MIFSFFNLSILDISRKLCFYVFLSLFLIVSGQAEATPEDISGTVNSYVKGSGDVVKGDTTISYTGAFRGAASSISAGDKLLLIQMQGAIYISDNTDQYGDGVGSGVNLNTVPTNLHGTTDYAGGLISQTAGTYEFVTVDSVVGSTLTLTTGLLNSYFDTGAANWQIVLVPDYLGNGVRLTGTVTAMAWDGDTGGIVSFQATGGSVDFNSQTINVSQMGFRGGVETNINATTDNVSEVVAVTANTGGKGEGIVGTPRRVFDGNNVIDEMVSTLIGGDFGRGAPGNAGGGAGPHNSGGGGGSNAGRGGSGGQGWPGGTPVNFAGYGGQSISSGAVMGGGGGSGESNNGTITHGGLGGGIVMIRANTAAGVGTINALGSTGPNATGGGDGPGGAGDGAGGGGAGGTVVMFFNTTTDLPALTINASGAKGSDGDPDHGGGGGGGAGYVATNATIGTVIVEPGAGGAEHGSGGEASLPGGPAIPTTGIDAYINLGSDFGDAPTSYGTVSGDNPAAHAMADKNFNGAIDLDERLYLGSRVDAEAGGIPGAASDSDDNGGSDDEDGILTLPPLNKGASTYIIPSGSIKITNDFGDTATLHAWIDFDNSGTFDSDEYASLSAPVGLDNSSPSSSLVWSSVPGLSGLAVGTTIYARFRLTADAAIDNTKPRGLAANGEVEDYSLIVDDKPALNSITRQTPMSEKTHADTVTFRVTFSEPVNNVDITDFVVTGPVTTSISSVTPIGGGAQYDVLVDVPDQGAGTIDLELKGVGGTTGSNDIKDVSTNALLTTFSGLNEDFILDNTAPDLIDINRHSPTAALTHANTLDYLVIFSENVTHLTPADFSVTGTGAAGATIDSVTGSGNTYIVTVDVNDAGMGVVDLNIVNTLGIQDEAGINLSSTTPTGNDQTYILDNAGPSVMITSASPANLSNQASYSVAGTCESGGSNVSVTIIGATPANQSIACSSAGIWNATFNVTSVTNGSNVINVSAIQNDALGNVSNTALVQANKDTVAPSVATTSAPVATIANQANYPVSGTCSSGDGDVTVAIAGATPDSQTLACTGSGIWSASFDVTAIADGINVINITASQTDSVGNTGSSGLVERNKVAIMDETKSTVIATNNHAVANNVALITLTATIKNVSNHFIEGAVVTFGQPGNVVLSTLTCTTNASGVCSVTAKSSLAATYHSTAAVDGVALAGTSPSPVSYTFVAGNIGTGANGTQISAASGDVMADNVATKSIMVQLKDALGNNISQAGVAVQFATTAGTLGTTHAVQTDANGMAINTVRHNAASSVSITAQIDTDGDNIVDASIENGSPVTVTFITLDSDHDGVNDSDEFIGDTDGDGVNDIFDADDDNDGIPTLIEGDHTKDTDIDGIPDYLDRESDGDGIPDAMENGIDHTAGVVTTDTDHDGLLDHIDADKDGDGFLDSDNTTLVNGNHVILVAPTDTDGDGIPNYLDLDTDNDGIHDTAEAELDTNFAYIDSDGDGIPDFYSPGTDLNNDGINDAFLTTLDYDGDGIPDIRDLDSDNDGILDVIEAGSLQDANNDGFADGTATDDPEQNGPLPNSSLIMNPINTGSTANATAEFRSVSTPNTNTVSNDVDKDGLVDNVDKAPDIYGNDADRDNDGILDDLDPDDDNDGIPDTIEGTGDTDGDGVPDRLDLDSDNDGLLDIIEASVNGFSIDHNLDGRVDADFIGIILDNPIDTDSDGIPDFQDPDSDGDGISDMIEALQWDAKSGTRLAPTANNNGDGLLDIAYSDINNIRAATLDFDGDGEPNYRDLDSDNDGFSDELEENAAMPGSNGDFDGDGVPDRLQVGHALETAIDGHGSGASMDIWGLLALLIFVFYSSFASAAHQCGKRLMAGSSSPAVKLIDSAQSTFKSCWYAGGALGPTRIDPEGTTAGAGAFSTVDKSDTGFKVYVGKHFKPRWFAEVSYVDFGAAKIGSANPAIAALIPNAEVTYKAPSVSAGYLLRDPTTNLNFFAKLGLGFIENESSDSRVPFKKQSTAQLMLGLGAQWNFGHGWFARAELESYDQDAQSLFMGIGKYFSKDEHEPKRQEVVLPPIVKTPICTLFEEVQFKIDSAELTPSSREALRDIYNKTQGDDLFEIEIRGHTDNQGSANYNQLLSARRAASVVDFLRKKGMDQAQLTQFSFGKYWPVADNATSEGRSLNRRVELHLNNPACSQIAAHKATKELTEEELKNSAQEHLQAWAKAWNVQNYEKYIASYIPFYSPRETHSYGSQTLQSKFTKAKTIEITLSDIKIELINKYHALAKFTQSESDRSNTHRNKLSKSTVLIRVDGQWRIANE